MMHTLTGGTKEEFLYPRWLVDWVVLRIYLASVVFQQYRDLEAGDNQSLKIQVARPGIEPRSSCSASQELNHSATAAPLIPSAMQRVRTIMCLT